MTRKHRISTRAGAGLPPAFACSPRADTAPRFGRGRLAARVAACAVAALTSCTHAPAVRTLAAPPRDGGSAAAAAARADSLERASVARADSLAGAPAVAGRADSLARAGAAAGAHLDSLALARVPADSSHRSRTGFAVPDSLRAPLGPFDYVWVVRTSLLSPQSIDSVVASAREEHVRGLLVQVIGRGDAYYRSDRLPRSEALPADDFDPLDRLVREAHAAGLEVHAWINCMLVWSADRLPRDRHHVVIEHPEWIARLKDGRKLSQLTPRQRHQLSLEGVFLAPAHPGVRAWIAENAQEIVRRYPIDGIHLDYIRQPVVAVGWDPTTRARFAMATGIDPGRFDRVPVSGRAHIDSLWKSFQSDQVRETVEAVRDSVRALRPGLPMSAAVIADTVTAEQYNAQRWRDWLRRGSLDRVFVMCYAPSVQTVMDQLLGYAIDSAGRGQIVPGIAVYNTTPAAAAAKIRGDRALGFPSLALYSSDALAAQPGYWPRLLGLLDPLP